MVASALLRFAANAIPTCENSRSTAADVAATMLSEQLRAAASPLRSWRPEYVPMVEAAQQRAMMQAQRRLAEEEHAAAAHGNDTKSAAVEEQRRVAERADAELAALQRCPS